MDIEAHLTGSPIAETNVGFPLGGIDGDSLLY